MRIALFTHSLLSDWNHGNAHFLRGMATELVARGHAVRAFEPFDAWSVTHLVEEQGMAPLARVRAVYPALDVVRYRQLDLEWALDGIDLVIVYEWTAPEMVARLGAMRRRFVLLFHDTHHRMVSNPSQMARYDLGGYDGVLAFGRVIRDLYLERRMVRRAWVWHEAADTRVFFPRLLPKERDLMWVGNWGGEERSAELREFLLEPARGLSGTVFGVRYPDEARRAVEDAGLVHAGWLANYDVPDAFGRHRVTIHVPRRRLRGIPTIRPFEALACGIPLVTASWEDEGLFRPGRDFLVAKDGDEMRRHLRTLLDEPEAAAELAAHGRRTIQERHTCAHRADELLAIAAELGAAEACA